MNELKINIKGMMCTGCENRIKNALDVIKGIKSVDVDDNIVIDNNNSDIYISIKVLSNVIQKIDIIIVV